MCAPTCTCIVCTNACTYVCMHSFPLQYVFWLQVSVHDVGAVQGVQGHRDLRRIEAGTRLGKLPMYLCQLHGLLPRIVSQYLSFFSQKKSSPPAMKSSTMYSLSTVWKAYMRCTRKGQLMFCRMVRSVEVCASWFLFTKAALRRVFIAYRVPALSSFFFTNITLPKLPLPST